MERAGDVQSVSRALDLLTRLGSSDEGQRLSELARAAGLAVSTAHRLLTTMQQAGFVNFDPVRSEWHVGREAFAVGAAYVQRRDFVAPAMVFLRRLRDESRETANLGILEDGQLVTLAQVESREITRAISPPGGRVAATCSAMGKALLATWNDEQIAVFCKRNGFRKLTPNSHRTLASLMADIKTIRKRGFAIDDEEHVVGLRCVAAVVCSPQSDAICALSVSGLANRLSAARANAVASHVVSAGQELAQKIGLC
jgi:IclR family acetate operon transcriptional repressor